ncbi:3-methyl-2-oxobutanoate hydroxymethyltransferase [Methylophaga frappieri]|uniref:3-methyl-2-oxobutanoate hydroxymethyltransferase n=1 Tax=Methylophaga frappieri (strain ATCC BAA-2434 / DSM 25690 / JAM7) TaxID=754477 RepID=I1YKY2_METFJ|nr:3-methyl-2-oxobutanoate hydroxymethyltransferase [Methylophaga frappieri]AFJ03575.1 3-methyl-2-oxobutanoate hydroxymethyltransferase [Methylophaga frappieri]
MSRLSLSHLRKMKAAHDKIAVLTAYDASFAQRVEQAGVEVILVGDSLGMVIQGQESTVPVTVDDMVYHTQSVVRGSQKAFIIADLPFMSYANVDQAISNAARLMAKGGAQMVKLEGGADFVPVIQGLTARGIPVCAHLGLLPQSVHRLGGYFVQGKAQSDAENMLREAQQLEQAGADMLVLECVPAALAAKIAQCLTIPVIGIGAGAECDGQVLVLYDMLGITPGKRPRFSHDFLQESGGQVSVAIEHYVQAVKQGTFPNAEQQF